MAVILSDAGCSGGNGGGGSTGASGPFTGTWSGANAVNVANYDTFTLSQSGASVSGTVSTISSQGTATDNISGTANGGTATVAVTNNGTVAIGSMTLTIGGGTLTAQWTGNAGAVTETLTTGGPCANPLVGTLNILNTYNVEQKSDMYIMVFNGAGIAIAQGMNQVIQDVPSGPYIVKTYGRAADGKIYTDDSWNLCSSSVAQVAACKVNQYTSNAGCKGRPLPHG
jgi:hypothetical protein